MGQIVLDSLATLPWSLPIMEVLVSLITAKVAA
jgi:hypothetical protein